MSHWAYYQVENLSRTLAIYELPAYQERTRENLFRNIEYIKEIRIKRAKKKPVKYSWKDLQQRIEKTEEYVKVTIRQRLKPGESAEVYVSLENVLPSRDVVMCASGKMSQGFELIVNHPIDLNVYAIPYHPSQDKFKTHTITPRLKHWQIEAGILPYQGIELSWRPVEAQDLVSEGLKFFSQREYSQAKSKFEIAQKIYLDAGIKEEESKMQEVQEMIGKCSKGQDAETAFEEGMEYYGKTEYENAETRFQISMSLYEEVNDAKGSQCARTMMEECQMKKKSKQ